MADDLADAIADIREQEALDIAKQMLDEGVDPAKLLEGCKEAMEIVGKRFEEGEYFLPELIISGEIFSKISGMAKPLLTHEIKTEKLGTIVLGTVVGDVHDLGKNIVTFMLEIAGVEVIDLGVDVPPEKFVEAIRENQPKVVGLSGLLTLAYDAMKETVEAIEAAGLREQVKIIIGGASIDERVRKHTGADVYGGDAMEAVSLVKSFL